MVSIVTVHARKRWSEDGGLETLNLIPSWILRNFPVLPMDGDMPKASEIYSALKKEIEDDRDFWRYSDGHKEGQKALGLFEDESSIGDANKLF